MTSRPTHTTRRCGHREHSTIGHHARTVALSLVTPLLEKNVLKTMMVDLPVVFSMSRLIVVGFAIAMIRQIWLAGISGWPDATLAVAVVLALPIVGALDRAKPQDVLTVANALVARFGVGANRALGSIYHVGDPSKFADHRDDSAEG
jgi:hypothetical protein